MDTRCSLSHSYHSPPQQNRKGENKMETKPPMDQDNSSLIRQKQRLCMEAKEKKDLSTTSHQEVMSSFFLGSRASVHVAVAMEEKFPTPSLPSPSLRPFSLLL